MKTNQLILIEGERRDWKLDPSVRKRGFEGVADARAALAASVPVAANSHDNDHRDTDRHDTEAA